MKNWQRDIRRLVTVIVLISSFCLGAPFVAAQAATIRVPAHQPTIQAAIDFATNGDTVLVAPGTYIENINFRGKAIRVTSEEGPEITIIDGNHAAPVVTFNSAEGAGSVLEGFTVRNGNGNFPFTSGGGGGIRIEPSTDVPPYDNPSPIIRGNIITKNVASGGAGISIYLGSPLISENVIVENAVQGPIGADQSVAGIAATGGSAVIIDNVISINTGAGVGLFGGIPTVRDNTISQNQGSGVYVSGSEAHIVQNLITGNAVNENGGMFFKGGGIRWVGNGPDPLLIVGNTIVDNDSPSGSGIFATGFFDGQGGLINNIVIGKAGQTALGCESLGGTELPPIRFNDIFTPGGQAFGGNCPDQTGLNGNISADPLFLEPSLGDYRPDIGSPVIDAGDNGAPEIPVSDFGGQARIVDGDEDGVAVVDMGAFEFSPTVGVLQFGASTYAISEDAAQAAVTIVRRGGNRGEVAVEFSATSGTATAGVDFTPVSGTITFADRETSKALYVPILQDEILEGRETVNLVLGNPTGGAILGARWSAVLFIDDFLKADDLFPAKPADSWTYQRAEDGATLNVKVLPEGVLINGVETKVFESSADHSQEYYSVDENGIRLHRMFIPRVMIEDLGRVNLTLTAEPPIQALANGVTAIGQTVNSSGFIRTNRLPRGVGELVIPYSATFTVEAFDNVTVPAGNFDVVRLRGTLDLSGQAPVLFSFDLADGIGAVRSTSTLLGVTETLELVAARVGIYDLAITKISAPRSVTLTARQPLQTKPVKVEVQNRSPHSEIVVDMDMLENLVTLTVDSLGSTCPDIVPVLHAGPPQKPLPLTIKPKQKLSVVFDVTFDCVNDPAKSSARDLGHEDFRYTAVVNHAALDGKADVHPADDICPRDRDPSGVDPYPDGSIRDVGCGNKKPDRSLGADVLTDVILK